MKRNYCAMGAFGSNKVYRRRASSAGRGLSTVHKDGSFDASRFHPPPQKGGHRPKRPRVDSGPPSPSSSSSLPSLIVERTPNPHDEPEEFYKALEENMMKVYRKLFIEGRSDVCSDEEMSDAGGMLVEYAGAASNSSTERRNSLRYFADDLVVESPHTDTEQADQRVSPDGDTADESEGTKTPTDVAGSLDGTGVETVSSRSALTEYSAERVLVTFRAEVHAEDSRTGPAVIPARSRELSRGDLRSEVLENNRVSDKSESIQEDDEEDDEDLEILENNGVSHKSESIQEGAEEEDEGLEILENNGVPDKSESIQEGAEEEDGGLEILESDGVPEGSHNHSSPKSLVLEMMRAPRIHSEGSLHSAAHGRQHSPDDHHTGLEEPRTMEANPEDIAAHRESQTGDFQHRVSTPVDLGDSAMIISTSCSSDESRTYNDVGTQTVLDRDDVKRMLSRIFVGTPKVLRLCSCVNHSCGL